MNIIRGSFRILMMSLVIGLGTVIILAIAWIPVRIKGVRLSAWPITYMSRILMRLFNIQYICREPDKFGQHHGFIFPNHLSYMDILMLIHLIPMRFVGKQAIRSWPFIGWIAVAIDTVFVNRQDKESRQQTRLTLSQIEPYPPVVLFPEGGILEPAEKLHPFRYGAFEIAVQGTVPFLPCAIMYDPLEIVYWGDESFAAALWRLASRSVPIQARLFALKVVSPQPEDDPQQLAVETHGAMEAILTYSERREQLLKSGI